MQSFERRLSLFSVVTISMSSMVGSGIFILPGLGFAATGPSLYLAFLLSAICILPAAMSKSELATAMPSSGGTYVYIERTFGPLFGTIVGLGLFLSILLKASFALVGIGAYFSVLSSFPLLPTILTFLVAIGLLNVFGVGKVSSILTVVLFITILAMVVLSVYSIPHWNFENFKPFLTKGESGLAIASGLVFVSFAGVTKVAAIAEEIKDPERNLPRGILLSLLIVTILYCGMSFILAAVFKNGEIAGDLMPIYRLADKVGGETIAMVVSAIAVLTMVNTSNAGVLAGSRFPFAMARDHLLPRFLGKLHKTFLTPIFSIILSVLIISVVLVTMDVTKIVKLASAFKIMIFMMVNVAVIVLRETRIQWYKPSYRSPFYPWVQVFGILAGILLLFQLGKLSIVALFVIAIPGIVLYFLYSRKRTTRRGVIGIRGKRTDLLQQDELAETGSPFTTNDFHRDAKVICSIFGKERSPEMLIDMGLAISDKSQLEVLHISEVPEQTSLHDMVEEPPALRSLRRRVLAMASETGESVHFDRVVSRDMSKTIFEISQRLHCKWLMIEYRGRNRGALTIDNPIGWLKSHLHCNLAVFRDTGIRYIRKIMVLINLDRNDSLVMETAEHLARVNKAQVTLVRFAKDDVDIEKVRFEKSYLDSLKGNMKVITHTKVLTGKNQIKTILAETVEFDLFVLGSADHSMAKNFIGSFDDKLIAGAACSVIAVHASSNLMTEDSDEVS